MMSSFHRYSNWLLPAFGFFVLFNLFDLSTTIFALKIGLSESNSALVFLASALGFGLIDFLVLIKSIFIFAAGFLVLIAMVTRNQNVKKAVFVSILGFALIYAVVVVSNFLSILLFV